MIVSIEDLDIAVRSEGDRGQPCVFFSHALGATKEMWDPQIAALHHAYHCVALDTRGHGETSAPKGPYTLDRLAADALAVMDQLGLEKVHWVGLSMGGMIGQTFALNFSDRLLSLSLCDTAAKAASNAAQATAERIAQARKDGMEAMADIAMPRWFTDEFLDAHPELWRPVHRRYAATDVDGFAGCCEAIRDLDTLGNLHHIDIPTLIIVGAEDTGTPVSASEAMQAEINGAILEIIPTARHLPNIEQADRFNLVLTEFLDKHARR